MNNIVFNLLSIGCDQTVSTSIREPTAQFRPWPFYFCYAGEKNLIFLKEKQLELERDAKGNQAIIYTMEEENDSPKELSVMKIKVKK